MNPVMVVEDDPDNLDSIVELLTEEGYDAIGVRTGREARERLTTVEPCLMLVDYTLPDMTGVDLVRMMREDHRQPEIPVVFLTAVSHPIESDIDAPVLAKPVMVEQLLSTLRQYCSPGARPAPPRP